MKTYDFSEYEVDVRSYGGSDGKKNILLNGKYYMVKMPNHQEAVNSLQTSVSNNVISEYIGSEIMSSLGLDTHHTLLGYWKDEIVVACEDFRTEGYELHEFSWYMQNVIPKEKIGKIPTYNQLYKTFNECPFLQPIRQQSIERYWNTIIGDALIGNFDRHKDNFGFLTNGVNIYPAPIYDCGACLYPQLSEESFEFVLSSEHEIMARMYDFPKIALNQNDNKNRENKFKYFELLSSNFDKECTKALLRIYEEIDMEKVHSIVEGTPFISDVRKNFYNKMLDYRKELILDKAYSIVTDLKEVKDNPDAYYEPFSREQLGKSDNYNII